PRPRFFRPELLSDDRPGGPRDCLGAQGQGDLARSALLLVRRTGSDALATPGSTGLDCELQRQVRHGVGPVPRTDLGAAEEARRHPAGYGPDHALGGTAGVDALVPDQKGLYAHMMEVFAACGANCDYHMGGIVDAVKQMPGADNTIFIYIAGDSGSSAEGGLEGAVNENLFFNGFVEKWQDNLKVIDELGGPKHFNHFPAAWAHAMDTPFQWTKQVASHFGGTRNPMIVSWPAKIKDRGGCRSQFMHVIAIVPTLYEVIGITPPDVLNGVTQKPIEGVSFAYTFDDAKAKERHTTQYFELGSNRGLYHDGWMASVISIIPWEAVHKDVDPDKQKWELYNIDKDFSQADDLAATNPQKLRELQDLWWAEAAKHHVLPLDWRIERLNAELMGRPSPSGHAKTLTYYEGQVGLPPEGSPRVLNKSWTLTADIEVPESGAADGMIATQGGIVGGYGL